MPPNAMMLRAGALAVLRPIAGARRFAAPRTVQRRRRSPQTAYRRERTGVAARRDMHTAATPRRGHDAAALASGGERDRARDNRRRHAAGSRMVSEVRLVGIQAPEAPARASNFPTWPLAEAAKAALGRARARASAAALLWRRRARPVTVGRSPTWSTRARIWIPGRHDRARHGPHLQLRRQSRARARAAPARSRGARRRTRHLAARVVPHPHARRDGGRDIDSFQLVEGGCRPSPSAAPTAISISVRTGRPTSRVVADARARRLCETAGLAARRTRRPSHPGARLDRIVQRPDDRAHPSRTDRGVGNDATAGGWTGGGGSASRRCWRCRRRLHGQPGDRSLELHRLHVRGRREAGRRRRPIRRCSRSSAAPPAVPSCCLCLRHRQAARLDLGAPGRPIHLHRAELADRQRLRDSGRLHLRHARAARARQRRSRARRRHGARDRPYHRAPFRAALQPVGAGADSASSASAWSTGSSALVNLAGAGAAVYLQGYSRDQEFEADTLGVRYLARANYDPRRCRRSFEPARRQPARGDARGESGGRRPIQHHGDASAHDRSRRAGDRGREARRRSPSRSRAATSISTRSTGCSTATTPRRASSKAAASRIRRSSSNSRCPRAIACATAPRPCSPRGRKDARSSSTPRRTAMAATWRAISRTSGRRSSGSTACSRSRSTAWRRRPRRRRWIPGRVAPSCGLRHPFATGGIYRFLCVGPVGAAESFDRGFRSTAASFRRLSDAEARALRPMRIRVVTVRGNDTVASLARTMPFEDHREERFRVLNGLGPNDALTPGQRVKLIVE